MPTYRVTQSERYRAVYIIEAESEEAAREMIEQGEIEDGTADTFDLVGADVEDVELDEAETRQQDTIDATHGGPR